MQRIRVGTPWVVLLVLAAVVMSSSLASAETVLRFGMWSAWDSLQPYNITTQYSIIYFDQIYDRLTYLTGEGQWKPRLADRWEWAHDYSHVTFYLNENARWHDGTPLTAEDVVFTVRVITHPEAVVALRGSFNTLRGTNQAGVVEDPDLLGVEAIGPHVVRFYLKNPMDEMAFFNTFIHRFWVYPKHLLENVAPSELHKDSFWRNPVGSGPWKWVREAEGQFIEFVKNEDYFLGAPKIDRMVLMVVPQANIAAALQTGEVDFIPGFAKGDVPFEDWETVLAMPHINAALVPASGTQQVNINNEQPHLADPRVRRAIWMAINRQLMVDHILGGAGVVARGPYAPQHPYFLETLPEIPYDPEGAKALLAEAGWNPRQRVTIVVPTGNLVRERAGTLIQYDLQQVGINAHIELMDLATAQNRMREGNYDIGLIGLAGSPDPDLWSVLHPLGGNNRTRHNITAIAEALDNGVAALGFENRKPYYDQLQLLVQEYAPVIYLFHENTRLAYNKRLVLHETNLGDFEWVNYNTSKWEIVE